MSQHKKIAWESWNAVISEDLEQEPTENPQAEEKEEFYFPSAPEEMEAQFGEVFITQPRVIHTPIGTYAEESRFKPSDRWDCWIGYTNFDITHSIAKMLEDDIDGVEALKILGRYTFFIGVGKMFNISNVRLSIEKSLCVYTEQEILNSPETKSTVDLVKSQLSAQKYWSMFVSPEGKVDYVVSNTMDKIYLDGLNGLIELKKDIGGIILRGEDG